MTTSLAAFVPFVRTDIFVPAGLTVLLSAGFSAESNCTEPGTTTTNWCAVRILIGGVEAEPVVGNDVAFDSTNGGVDEAGAWESHSMDRHRCYTNTSAALQTIPVVVEWGTTNFDGGAAPVFRLDDWSLMVQESLDCFNIPVPPAAAAAESQEP